MLQATGLVQLAGQRDLYADSHSNGGLRGSTKAHRPRTAILQPRMLVLFDHNEPSQSTSLLTATIATHQVYTSAHCCCCCCHRSTPMAKCACTCLVRFKLQASSSFASASAMLNSAMWCADSLHSKLKGGACQAPWNIKSRNCGFAVGNQCTTSSRAQATPVAGAARCISLLRRGVHPHRDAHGLRHAGGGVIAGSDATAPLRLIRATPHSARDTYQRHYNPARHTA